MTIPAGDYSIAAVHALVDDRLRDEVTAFWVGNGALPDAEVARRRADELVCVARNAAGQIVGVNTAYVASLGQGPGVWFHYRMFLRAADRHLRLSRAMMRAAVDALRERGRCEPAVRGIVLVTENAKLLRRGAARQLSRLGWHKLGRGPRGLDVWTIEFGEPAGPPTGRAPTG